MPVPMTGGRTSLREDCAESDPLPEPLRKDNPFVKVLASPSEAVNVDELWQTLTRYASGYSWVSPDKASA